MSHPSRYFPPCSLLLRLQQVRQIFEYDHVTGAIFLMPQRRHGDRYVQGAARKLHFQLAGAHPHAITTTQKEFKILHNFGGKDFCGGRAQQAQSGTFIAAIGMEHPQKSLINMGDSSVRVERQHTRRNALENRLELAPPLVEFRIGSTQFTAGSFDLTPARSLNLPPCG